MGQEDRKQDVGQPKAGRFQVVKLEERIAPGQSHFPPGQFPAGNPAQAPGNSNSPGNSGR
jgi:hypothetical protein